MRKHLSFWFVATALLLPSVALSNLSESWGASNTSRKMANTDTSSVNKSDTSYIADRDSMPVSKDTIPSTGVDTLSQADIDTSKVNNDTLPGNIDDKYAYLQSATASNPIDVTSWLTSSDCSSLVGWSVLGSPVWSVQKSSYTNGDVSMSKFIERWVPASSKLSDGIIYQRVKAIPNGIYSLSIDAIAVQQSNASDSIPGNYTGVWLYLGRDLSNVADSIQISTANNTPRHFTVDMNITDSVLVAAFEVLGSTCNWVAFDNMKLSYKGNSADIYKNKLQTQLAEASLYIKEVMESSVLTALSSCMSASGNLIQQSNVTTNQYSQQLSALMNAIFEAKSSISAYADLKITLDSALQFVYRTDTSHVDISSFSKMIAEYSAGYNGRTLSSAQCLSAKNVLDTELRTIKNSSIKNGDDITSLLVNPSFSMGTKGWIGVGTVENAVCEHYNKAFDTYQILTELPNGTYTVKAQAFVRTASNETAYNNYVNGETRLNTYLYANDAMSTVCNVMDQAQSASLMTDSTAYSPSAVGLWANEYQNSEGKYIPNSMYGASCYFNRGLYENTVTTTVTDGTLRLGIKMSELPGYDNSSWVLFDNFQVFCGGSVIPVDTSVVSIHVATPGTLGQLALSQVGDLSQIKRLKLSGTLNDDDKYTISSHMPSLVYLDMTGVTMTQFNNFLNGNKTITELRLPSTVTEISEYALQNSFVKTVVLPSTVSVIRYGAFNNCRFLKKINFPKNLSSIGDNAFSNCISLDSVDVYASSIEGSVFYGCFNLKYARFHEGLTVLSSYTFYDCNKLNTVLIPSTLNTIGNDAFNECRNLNNIRLNERLTRIEYHAFNNCDSLTEINIPSSVIYCNRAFDLCDNLKTLKCYAVIPPKTDNNMVVDNVSMSDKILYVPSLSLNNYKVMRGWDNFSTVLPLVDESKNIYVYKDFNIMSNTRPSNKPNVYLIADNDNCGNLNIEGADIFSAGKFDISDNPYNDRYATLINASSMRADSVSVTSMFNTNIWQFFSFPYDVKVSDITVPAGTMYVIRSYSGKNRAKSLMDSTWINMTSDSTLHAGRGYILMCSNNSGSATFVFHAVDNTNKNLIFSNTDRTIALDEYLSEFGHNRSWNLIGNPYPCYYDTRKMDFTAPFTVWNRYEYKAYSPVDDQYILKPNEAFFVQRPVDQSSIVFALDGRQSTSVASSSAAARMQAKSSSVRNVYNLTLSDNSYSDATRFVINDNASSSYEMSCDASKFMSSNTSVPQLFTCEGNVNYAINERPFGTGVITLGMYIANDGNYTLSLNEGAKDVVTLVDRETGEIQVLNDASYTFTAKSGLNTSRFLVKLGGTTDVNATSSSDHVKVTVSAGLMTVSAPLATGIEVYSADGIKVASSYNSNASFNVKAGYYFVKVNGEVRKVSVVR